MIDIEPREVSDEEVETLQDLAAIVMDELELRLPRRRCRPGADEIARVTVLPGSARGQTDREALERGASAYVEKGEAFSTIGSTLLTAAAVSNAA